jgi:ArsR family transcriptional regulator, virulence genes transcriptional regulator
MAKYVLDPRKLEDAASKFRAISHPMRIAIIQMLENEKQLNVTQIHNRLEIEQAAASHHLNLLKSKGVLDSKRIGKNTFYTLRPNIINIIKECLDRCSK